MNHTVQTAAYTMSSEGPQEHTQHRDEFLPRLCSKLKNSKDAQRKGM